MSDEEFRAAKSLIKDTNDMAWRFYRLLNPDLPLLPYDTTFDLESDPAKDLAWRLACEAARHHLDDDPEIQLEELNDYLDSLPDPCEVAKDYELAA